MKVLIAEDDPNTRKGLAQILEGEGYQTHPAANGTQALEVFEREKPGVVCLDIMMPGDDGYAVCQKIRKLDETVPILFISAKSEEIDKVVGLELGADDFIVKPFGVKEVVARIRAVTRRCLASRDRRSEAQNEFEMGDLKVVPAELRVYRGQSAIEVSLRDIKILTLLHTQTGKAVSRDLLLNECWGLEYYPNSRCLDQHISQLRKRVEKNAAKPAIIRTVHGVGYRYDE
ncbi:MAG: DNA-binding response regulator [Verrucomicrobiales bacterium]|nr:DNA-binding response regulator [Verrucomicrobiales bacterium]